MLKALIPIVTGISLLAPAMAIAAPAIQLPKTGQTLCYNPDNPVAPGGACGAATAGQDGQIQAGVAWPNPRFVNLGGTMLDNLTDLVWLQNANCFNGITWQRALGNAATVVADCGVTDGSTADRWRLPNRKEMLSLVNYGSDNFTSETYLQQVLPWLNTQGFTNAMARPADGARAADLYWTSDTLVTNPADKWVIHLVGDTHGEAAGSTHFATYVRDVSRSITVEPQSADLGSAVVGHAATTPATFTLTNNGLDPVTVASFAISGADAASFAVNAGDGTAGTCGTAPRTLPPGNTGNSCTVSVTFTPATAGAKTASLTVSTNVASNLSIERPLTGTGTVATFTVTPRVEGGNGTAALATPGPVAGGSTAAVTLTPATGYAASPTVTGTCPAGTSNGATYTTGAITADCEVVFSFAPVAPVVTITPAEGGTIVCTPGTGAAAGTTTCVVTPNTGNRIDTVTVDAAPQPVTDRSTYTQTFGVGSGNHTMAATFSVLPPNSFEVTVNAQLAQLVPLSRVAVAAGSTTTINLQPLPGYRPQSATGCNGTLSGTTFTTGPITADCAVTVTYTAAGLEDVLKAFQSLNGRVQLTDADRTVCDVAPLGTDGKPAPDAAVDISDIVIMLRRITGLVTF